MSNALFQQLQSQQPFNLVDLDDLNDWFSQGKLITYGPGDRILRPDEISDSIFVVISGQVRLLEKDISDSGLFTLSLRGSGQILGWINLLRGAPTEFVQASVESQILALPASKFISIYKTTKLFSDFFDSLFNFHEAYKVYSKYVQSQPRKDEKWDKNVLLKVKECASISQDLLTSASENEFTKDNKVLLLSTPGVKGYPVGKEVSVKDAQALSRKSFSLPLRFIVSENYNHGQPDSEINDYEVVNSTDWASGNADLYALGILEEDNLSVDSKFPTITARSEVDKILAIAEMIAKAKNVPFRRDNLYKLVKSKIDRNQQITIETYAGICESMTLNASVSETDPKYVGSIEFPVICSFDSEFVVLWDFKSKNIIYTSPSSGLKTIPFQQFIDNYVDSGLKFIKPERTKSSPSKKFGWSWFTPLLLKYKKSIGLVFAASLLSQLFTLAIPLLIQQIIDKVLSQGNVSSLNILGGVMILLALFSGLLKVLRTYVFVDTTDRMDLTLGSSVIGKLLSLPISFFEKRPVGELSQRLGELNSIRGFLTGTALISVLNIIFALLYLVVMFIYSPYLSVIALSTFPLYLLLVFVVSPIYKSLIRKRAIAQAKTQSHLIEVLSGYTNSKGSKF